LKIQLNLASQPFRRERLFWVSAGANAIALLAIAGLLLLQYASHAELPPEQIAMETKLRAEMARLSAEERQVNEELGDAANEEVLERSMFLNQLITRKGISWTRTFADLEKVLPPKVLMMQIRPEVTATNNVVLEMQVGAETGGDFIEFLKALESSELFGRLAVRGSSPPTENQPLWRYQLTVQYEQRL
jgi:type IV pilus assembly protein PilN